MTDTDSAAKRVATKEKPMATRMTLSVAAANAVSMAMEQNPQDWGANEHLAFLRYLVLQCSDKSKMTVEELKARAADKNKKPLLLAVDWDKLATEFHQSGKFAECANMKKYNADDYPQFKTQPKGETKYC